MQPLVAVIDGEGVEDGVQQKLAEVVDAGADEGRDGQVVGALALLLGRERLDVNAGEVQERVLVVGAGIGLGLEVVGVGVVEGGVHDRLDRVEVVEDSLGCIQILARTVEIREVELHAGDSDRGEYVGILGIFVVDLLDDGFQKGEALLVVWSLRAQAWLVKAPRRNLGRTGDRDLLSTSTLCGGLESKIDELELVDLVGELENEDLVEL